VKASQSFRGGRASYAFAFLLFLFLVEVQLFGSAEVLVVNPVTSTNHWFAESEVVGGNSIPGYRSRYGTANPPTTGVAEAHLHPGDWQNQFHSPSYSGSPAQYFSIWVTYEYPANWILWTNVTIQTGSNWLYLPALTNGVACDYYASWGAANASAVPVIFHIFRNGQQVESTSGTTLFLNPGESGTATFNAGTNSSGYTVQAMTDAAGYVAIGGGVYFTGGVDSSGNTLYAGGEATAFTVTMQECSAATPTAPNVYTQGFRPGVGVPGGGGTSPPDYTSTNAPIKFNTNVAATNGVSEGTFKEGVTALYEALKEQTKVIGASGEGIKELLRDLAGELGGTGTNDFGALEGAINSFHLDNTNLLGLVYKAMTNRAGTEELTELFTNLWIDAETTGNGLLESSGYKEASDGLFSAFENMEGEPDVIGDVNDALLFGFTAGDKDYEMNFSPFAVTGMGNLYDVARKLFGWLMAAGYALLILKDIMRLVQVAGTAQQMSVPDIEGSVFGFGGNANVLVIPVFTGLMLAVFATLFAGAATEVTTLIGGDIYGSLAANPLQTGTGSVSTGINLARNFFPFSLMFGFLIAYGMWKVTCNFLCVQLIVIIRFMVGG